MSELALILLRTVGLAILAVSIIAPLAALSGWHAAAEGPAARSTRACLQVLAALPIVVFGLLLIALVPVAAAWWVVVLALALGGYAPLALSVADARESLGRRLERDALALGATPRAVFFDVTVPVLRPALVGASLRAVARLTGETGLFIVAFSSSERASTLGARLFTEATRGVAPVTTLLLLLCAPVMIAACATRLERQGRA